MGDAQIFESDVTFLKKLANDGRGKPAPMALLLTGFGLVFGVMFFLVWAVFHLSQAGVISGPMPRWIGVMFGIPIYYILPALLAGSLIHAWLRRDRIMKVNRVAAAGWMAAGISLIVIFANILAIWKFNRNVAWAFGTLPSSALVLWGSAWMVSATATGQKWLYYVAAGSFLAALFWAFPQLNIPILSSGLNGFLLISLCFLLLAFLPGVILLRKGQA